MCHCCHIRISQKKFLAEMRECRRQLRAIAFLLSCPGRMRVRVTQEDGKMLGFVVTLPPPGATDVVTRELSVAIGGGEAVVVNPAVDAAESDEFMGNQGDAVHLELVDVDDAGNRSQPSLLDAVLQDTLAPQQPGEMGVRVTREE